MGSLPQTTADTIALTEKKMDMTLDDIIKMSQKNGKRERKQPQKKKCPWAFPSKKGAGDAGAKSQLQRSVAARSSALRQGKLAESRGRSGFRQFTTATEASKIAARTPIRTRPSRWMKRREGNMATQANCRLTVVTSGKAGAPLKQRPQTLDSLFANIREQRLMRTQGRMGGRATAIARLQHNFGSVKTKIIFH
eukprot:TRINITY_DN1062_c0_g1_i4.p1 TRINITY_DN1062_c0_g1~~TRINITY_DN1062_c0_g1_i4.p1  ORF type:complete len:194 (+),score=28.04 TRINITY_DN1062_c0_g1_i4:383-964(+)